MPIEHHPRQPFWPPRQFTSGLRKMLAVLAIAGLAIVGTALPSDAHTGLSGSNPLDGEALATRPEVVQLRFNQTPLEGYSKLQLVTENGGAISLPALREAGQVVSQPVPPLASGRYTMNYRIVSPDGHPISGKIKFSVEIPGEALGPGGIVGQSSPNPDAPPAAKTDDGSPVWWWIIVGAVGLLAIIVLVIQRRIRTSVPAEDTPAEPAQYTA